MTKNFFNRIVFRFSVFSVLFSDMCLVTVSPFSNAPSYKSCILIISTLFEKNIFVWKKTTQLWNCLLHIWTASIALRFDQLQALAWSQCAFILFLYQDLNFQNDHFDPDFLKDDIGQFPFHQNDQTLVLSLGLPSKIGLTNFL